MIIGDLTNMRFGKWTAVKKSLKKYYYTCSCICGKEKNVYQFALVNKKSSGCHKCSAIGINTSHKKSSSKIYSVWVHMIQRCTNKNAKDYKYYGARGIKVCDRWLDFANFYHDMNDPPPGMEIDRTNNDGNYEPLNCRWVSKSTNRRNRRKFKNTSSKFIGVCWNKANCKWSSRIRLNNTRIFLGLFDSEEEAGARYQQAKLELETTGKITV